MTEEEYEIWTRMQLAPKDSEAFVFEKMLLMFHHIPACKSPEGLVLWFIKKEGHS